MADLKGDGRVAEGQIFDDLGFLILIRKPSSWEDPCH